MSIIYRKKENEVTVIPFENDIYVSITKLTFFDKLKEYDFFISIIYNKQTETFKYDPPVENMLSTLNDIQKISIYQAQNRINYYYNVLLYELGKIIN